MEHKNTILIAGGKAEPELLSTLENLYLQQGWEVYFSQQTEYEKINQAINTIIIDGRKLNAFIYISPDRKSVV